MWIEKENEAELIPPKIIFDIIVRGPGHIAPIENCSITEDMSEIVFCNPAANAAVRVIPDNENGKCDIHMGNVSLSPGTAFVMLLPDGNYDTIYFDFS